MTEIYFADKKVEKTFNELKFDSANSKLYKFIKRAIEDIRETPGCGIAIPKNLIPKIYIRKYGINNLFKYDLPSGWRLLYSLEEGTIEVMAIVIEWMHHKDYERRFGYRAR
jgi:hypothetical protein